LKFVITEELWIYVEKYIRGINFEVLIKTGGGKTSLGVSMVTFLQ
jgi:hypothetical protein